MRKITTLNFSLILLFCVAFLAARAQNQMTTSAKLEYQVQTNAKGILLKKLPTPDLESSPMISEYKPDLTRAILWAQMTPSDGLIASQDFEASFDAYDCKGADDFVVTDGPWTVGVIKFLGGYWNGSGPAQSFNIEFYNNNAGIPGASIVSFTNLPYTAVAVGSIFEFTVYIPAQVFANGHYWISIQARMDYGTGGQYGWQPHAPPQVQNERHWINPGGGFGCCTSWTPGTTVWPSQVARDLCFQLETPPACPEPVGLYAADITQTEADLYWTPVGGTTSFNIEVGLQGFTPGTGNEVTGATGVTDIPWRAKELSPNTVYQFYVQSDCGARSLSEWAGPHTFVTLCDPVAAVDEDFEGTLFPPLCWSLVAGSSNWARSTLASGYGVGTASARANFYSIQGSTPFDLVSPEFNITQAQVTFDHAYATYVNEVDRLRILYSTDGGANYTQLIELLGGVSGPLVTAPPTTASFIPTAAQWATKTYALPAGANKVKFQAVSAFGNNLYIDNVVIEEYIPGGCPAPTSLTVSNISETTADLGWTPVGTETQWNVEVGLLGFTPGSNQFIFQAIGITSNPITATGLSAGTTYQFYVQADCGATRELSSFAGPQTFTTRLSCPVGGVAELEACGADDNGGCNSEPPEFEAITIGTTVCGTGWFDGTNRDTDWYEFILTETTIVTWSGKAEFPFLLGLINGNAGCPVGSFIVSTTGNANENKTVSTTLTPGTYWAFFAPQFVGNTLCGGFDRYFASLTGDVTSIPPNDLCSNAIPINCTTGSINGTTVGATFDAMATCGTTNTAPGVWYLFTTDVVANVDMDLCNTLPTWDSKLSVYEGTCAALTCVTGNDDFCGLLSGVSFLAQPGINYYVLVHGFSTATGAFQLDISCEPLAGCPAPINLTASNITPTSADLDWTEVGSATQWNLEWGEAGFTQGSGTLVTGITTKPYPLTGLDPNTEYEFYVQSDCGDEARALSEWAGPLTFKTLCITFNLPFSEDFSGIPNGGFPDCWSVTATGAENWFVVDDNAAGGISPEMLLIWGPPAFVGTSRLVTPVLNTGGATDFKISLNQFLDDWSTNEGDYIAIEYSVDGGNTWFEIWQFVTDMNYGPAFDEFSFSIPGGNDDFIIAFTFVGNSFNIDGWLIDDVLIVVDEPEVPENRNIDGVANLNDCYDATNTITVTNSTVPNGSSAYFKAGVNIIFGNGFVVESGGYMHAEITTVYCNPPALLSAIEEAPAIVLPEITEPTALFRVYPNPTTGLFKMELLGGEDDDINVEIYNMMGERVFQDRLFGSMIYEFNLNSMPRGIYFIRAMRGSETGIEKVIRQ